MRAAPAVPCAKKCKKTHTSIQVQRRTSDIPCAMALRLITRSPRRRIRLVTVVGELAASPRPVGPACLRQLDTSNGCRNHTTSPYAAAPFVSAPFDRSRVWLNPKPALPSRFTPNAAASTASRPASLTIRIRPSVGQDGEVYIPESGQAKQKYFCKRGWTATRNSIACGIAAAASTSIKPCGVAARRFLFFLMRP